MPITPSKEPVSIDYERVLDADDAIALEEAEKAVDASMDAIDHHQGPLGNDKEATASRLPEGIAERIEGRLSTENQKLRLEYYTLLSLRGGKDAVDIASTRLARMLKNGVFTDDMRTGEYASAVSILGTVGGPDAFEALLSLHHYPFPDWRWNAIAREKAHALYAYGAPRDLHTPAAHAPDESTPEQTKRSDEFDRLYPRRYAVTPTA